jgi:Tol biopolymer transport system component
VEAVPEHWRLVYVAGAGAIGRLAEETQQDKLREALAHAVESPQLAGDADLVALLTRLTEAEIAGTGAALPAAAALPASGGRQMQRLRKRLYEYRESHPSRRFHIYIPRDSVRPVLRTPGLRREERGLDGRRLWWFALPLGVVGVALGALIWSRLAVQEESEIFRFGEGREIQQYAVAADESFFVFAAQPDTTKPAGLFRAGFGEAEAREIDTGGRAASYPAIAPDGRRLAYWRREENGRHSLVLREIETGKERVLLENAEASALGWDTPGEKVLATVGKKFVSVSDTGVAAALHDTPGVALDGYPAPRPRHADIAFVRQIAGGAASLQLSAHGATRGLVEGLYQFRGHAWSPDGEHLYFAAEYQGERGLWRFHMGSKFVERARVGGRNSHSPVVARRIFWLDEAIERKLSRFDAPKKAWSEVAMAQVPLAAPVFSRDGSQWAMRVQEAGRTTFLLHPRNYTLSLSDLEVRGSAVWSLDSRSLVFPARRTGRASLYLQALEGGLPKLLASCPAEVSSPRFSAEGRWLAFLCGAELYKMAWPPDGGEARRISIEAWRALEYDAVTNSVLACGFDFRRSRVDLDRDTFERLPAPLEFLDPPYLAASRREYFFASPLGTLRRQTQRAGAFAPLADSPPPASDTDRAVSAAPDGSVVFVHSRKVNNQGLQGMRLPAN